MAKAGGDSLIGCFYLSLLKGNTIANLLSAFLRLALVVAGSGHLCGIFLCVVGFPTDFLMVFDP